MTCPLLLSDEERSADFFIIPSLRGSRYRCRRPNDPPYPLNLAGRVPRLGLLRVFIRATRFLVASGCRIAEGLP